MTTQLQFEDSKVNFNSAAFSHLMKFRFAAAAALQSQSGDANVLAFQVSQDEFAVRFNCLFLSLVEMKNSTLIASDRINEVFYILHSSEWNFPLQSSAY